MKLIRLDDETDVNKLLSFQFTYPSAFISLYYQLCRVNGTLNDADYFFSWLNFA